ncbi:hypothetical protein [Adhaeribacter aquaticus]|uniref:hypothetical protein n=1 Tax=Adhaeribacter aquaticus TaxID=299567 RepID=UPI0004178C3C|nr:hypothetical protein [Adhaeribacter aquaticus]
MNYLALGSEVEYQHAAKRLEEIFAAAPNTLEAQERKELIQLIVKFEREILKLRIKESNESIKQ